jgi:hypothetical protein
MVRWELEGSTCAFGLTARARVPRGPLPRPASLLELALGSLAVGEDGLRRLVVRVVRTPALLVSPRTLPDLAAPSTPARNDVHQRNDGDDDHDGDGDNGNGGSGEDHAAFLSCSSFMKTSAARRYVSVVSRNVLVISTVEHADDVLRAHVGEADTIKVVVPVVRQGVLDWLANDQEAFGHAERVAERTAERLSGETVDAVAGEADVGLAIRDALATFTADEIVVAVRPEEEEGFVESSATDTARQDRLVEGVPVRVVVIGD